MGVIGGLLLRIVLAVSTVWPDAYTFTLLAARTMAHPGATYTSFNVYPAAWFAITFFFLGPPTLVLGLARLLVSVPDSSYLLHHVPSLALPSIPAPWVSLVLKAPWIAADFVTALLIYRIVRDLSNEATGARAFMLWWLSPIAIVNSSVLGQYDSTVALLTLLAVHMTLHRAFLGAGIAFGLGLALKPTGSPIFVLLAGLTLASRAPNVRTNVLPARRGPPFRLIPFLRFGAGFLMPFLGLWLGNRLLGVGASLQTRLQFPVLGGINLWLVELIPHGSMQTLWRWGHTYFTLVQEASLVAGLLAAALTTVLLLRLRRVSETSAYMASAASLLLFLLVTPLAQPHYFIVAYPFLAICTALSLLPKAGYQGLSFALTGYVLSVWGPLIIWLPLAVNFHLINPRLVMEATVLLTGARGVLNGEALRDFRLLFGMIGFACAIWIAVAGVWRLFAVACVSALRRESAQ